MCSPPGDCQRGLPGVENRTRVSRLAADPFKEAGTSGRFICRRLSLRRCFCFLSCIVTMLAHGTGGCQWLAVIVFFFFGGAWIHDPVVLGPMTSCVTKLMAAQNLRLKENFCALDFVVPTIASEAQEYYPGIYQAGTEWLGPFDASSEVVVGTKLMGMQKSRIKKIFVAYDFLSSNITTGAQEYDSMVFQVERDHVGMLNSSVVGEFDEFDMQDPFYYVGHLAVGFDLPGQHSKRQECLRRAQWGPDFHVLLFCFLSNMVYSRWK